ncbi:MAG: DUF1801 domain-containing protein [Candidatus Dormibacteraeota bacterium]|nr:DUF1801 domain-containing protein [Candidatus Dormibacteraeota bacterium]
MDEQRPHDVDAYIASAPAAAQPHLRTLRAIVKSEAPDAEERLSYGMPHYDHHGRLVYFAVNKAHVGVYGLTGRSDVPRDLREYFAARGTLRFAFDRPLPIAALHVAVRARVDQNQAHRLANKRAADTGSGGARS